MICPECRHENRDSAKFCEGCGGPLLARCPACGTALRPGARFCDECGQPLAAGSLAVPPGATPRAPASAAEVADELTRKIPGYTPRHLAEKILTSRSALEGERKLVTVLFADCVGFTALSTRLDPEELHAVMDGCFRHMLDAVHRYEGTVNQFTGDGVMALFGAPISHEDHAVRAVAAALAVQAAMARYAETLRLERGLDFAVRIGLNTGPVVVGRIGDDLRMDYTAQGETVNLAARLQGAAPPGGVLVSEATHRVVGGYFLTADQGTLLLKGIEGPVRAFTVTGQRTRRARFDLALERGLTPLAGRSTELALLLDCFEKVRAGRGHVVSLVGEAGVGKSRLAYELRLRLHDAPLTYLEAHCLPHGGSLPFQAIVQFLEGNFRLEEGEPEAEQIVKVEAGVRRLDPALDWTIPYLQHLLSLPAPGLEADGLDPAQRKRRLIEAVKALTLRGAQHRPLFLVVDDLQWADPSSEEYLASLVDSLAGHRVLLVCTYRTGHAPPWQDRSSHLRLALDPLSHEDTVEMVKALLSVPDLAPSMRDLVIKRSEGNPLFIEELATYLRDRDLLPRSAPASASGWEPGEVEVPETIHDLLTARIDRLAEPLKRTLQIASVLGRDFSLALLEAVAPADLDIRRHLADLVRGDLLREKDLFPEVRYSFSHVLTQQVAYQGLLVKSRADLHGRAATALERLYEGRADEVLDELAEHWARSADRPRAVESLLRAGDRAAALYAYHEAEAYFGRALEALGPEHQPGRRDVILEKLGDAAFARGGLGEARSRWSESLALVEAAADRRRAADLHRKLGAAAWAAGDREASLAHLERGLAVLGEDESLELARLCQELGRIHFRLGRHDLAVDWAQRALALGERLAAPDVVSHAYNTLGVALARAGDLEGGAAQVSRSLETALAGQLGSVACRAYTNLAVMYSPLDHGRSAAFCREGLALAQKIGDLLQQPWLYCALAGGHCTVAGDYDEGVKAAEAAVELDRRLGQRNHLPIPLIILAQIYQCRGDYPRSGRYYEEALAVAESVGEPQLLCPCYEGLATLAVEQGDEAEADRWLEKSRHTQETTGWTSDTFLLLPFLC